MLFILEMKDTWGNVNACGTHSNHYACKGQNPINKHLKKTTVMLMYKELS